MSDKIKSKDLKYDSSLPPFLQRLHDQRGAQGDGDRHERAIARPKKPKEAGDDDEPTVVDERGETLTKKQFDEMTNETSAPASDAALVKGELNISAEPMASGALPDDAAKSNKQVSDKNITNGTAQKKRKAAKVVGDDDVATENGDEKSAIAKTAKKAKKKAKVKLAFNDDEEEDP